MADTPWDYCQVESDHLLASGLTSLLSTSPISHDETIAVGAGIYLFSQSSDYYYIGESIDVFSRLKSQLNPRTSTFYKNYLKTSPLPVLPIGAFELRVLSTRLARKELEEFGIVNLPTTLNRFHSNKRKRFSLDNANTADWDRVQACSELILEHGEAAYEKADPVKWKQAIPSCTPGLYRVQNANGDLVYIGESVDLEERHRTHGTRTYFSALRRNIGRSVFGFEYIPGTKKKFEPEHDASVSEYIHSCFYSSIEVSFARRELEERLIQRHRPRLNRKTL